MIRMLDYELKPRW